MKSLHAETITLIEVMYISMVYRRIKWLISWRFFKFSPT